jgi:hypothetical protein
MPGGRPKKDDKRSNAHQFLLDDEEEAAFERLVQALDREASRFGGKVTPPAVVRIALATLCEERGIAWPKPEGQPADPPPRKPASRTKKRGEHS